MALNPAACKAAAVLIPAFLRSVALNFPVSFTSFAEKVGLLASPIKCSAL